MHPGQSQLPVERDFGDPENLDVRWAIKNFLGKSSDEAEAMFRDNFLIYQEDLMWMDPPAFRFYVMPAMKYLLSRDADGDSDAASTFCSLIEFRMDTEPASVKPIAPVVADVIRQILVRFDRFECTPDIYGDVPGRYRALVARLEV